MPNSLYLIYIIFIYINYIITIRHNDLLIFKYIHKVYRINIYEFESAHAFFLYFMPIHYVKL